MSDNKGDIGFLDGYNYERVYEDGHLTTKETFRKSDPKFGIDFQSMYDLPTNLFKYDTGNIEDPTLLTFELQFDNDSPLFKKDVIYKFLDDYYGGDIARKNTYDEFFKSFFRIFRFKFDIDYDKAGYGRVKKDYYITQITGLDNLTKKIVNYIEDKVTITVREDVTMLSQYMIDCYNNLIYSFNSNKAVIPENLLRFNLKLTVRDVRNFKIYDLVNKKQAINEQISKVVYTLYDCNLLMFNSKNFGTELKTDSIPTESNISFDIIYKSYSKATIPGLLYINNTKYADKIINYKEQSYDEYIHTSSFDQLYTNEADMATNNNKAFKNSKTSIYTGKESKAFAGNKGLMDNMKDVVGDSLNIGAKIDKTISNAKKQVMNAGSSLVVSSLKNIKSAIEKKLQSFLPSFEKTNVYSDSINDMITKTVSFAQNSVSGFIDKGVNNLLDTKNSKTKMFDINKQLSGDKQPHVDYKNSMDGYPKTKVTQVYEHKNLYGNTVYDQYDLNKSIVDIKDNMVNELSNDKQKINEILKNNTQNIKDLYGNSIYDKIILKDYITNNLNIMKDTLLKDKTIVNKFGNTNPNIDSIQKDILNRMNNMTNKLSNLDYKILNNIKHDLKNLNYMIINKKLVDAGGIYNIDFIALKRKIINLSKLEYQITNKLINLSNLDYKVDDKVNTDLSNLDYNVDDVNLEKLNKLDYNVDDKVNTDLSKLDYNVDDKVNTDLSKLDYNIDDVKLEKLNKLDYNVDDKVNTDLSKLDYNVDDVKLEKLNKLDYNVDDKNIGDLGSVYKKNGTIINKNVLLNNIYKDSVNNREVIDLGKLDEKIDNKSNLNTNLKNIYDSTIEKSKPSNIINNVNDTPKKSDNNENLKNLNDE